jgi:hypothetical protein
MAGPKTVFIYESDDGASYQMAMDHSNGLAAGGAFAAGTEPYLPPRHIPRYILAQHPTSGQQRRIVMPDPAAALWTGTGGTIALVDTSVHPSVSTTYQVRGRVGEKRYASTAKITAA